jgi:hypothetical protein
MTKHELHDLLRFADLSIESLVDELEKEINGIVESSKWGAKLRPISQSILRSILTKLSPGLDREGLTFQKKDTMVAATWLLSELLGGDSTLQTLDEMDEKMLLIPRDDFDDHLRFFGKPEDREFVVTSSD